jgi:hypothetical protein
MTAGNTGPGGAGPGTARAAAGPANSARGVRLDIRRVTLDGYSPLRRKHFAQALTAQLTRRGAPAEQAHRAAEAILDAVDARLGGPGA